MHTLISTPIFYPTEFYGALHYLETTTCYNSGDCSSIKQHTSNKHAEICQEKNGTKILPQEAPQHIVGIISKRQRFNTKLAARKMVLFLEEWALPLKRICLSLMLCVHLIKQTSWQS